jgi:hypothetical protein
MDTIGDEIGTNFPSLAKSSVGMVYLSESSVTTIGYRMFEDCDHLWDIHLSEKVPLQRIGSLAFYNCKNLTSVSGKY